MQALAATMSEPLCVLCAPTNSAVRVGESTDEFDGSEIARLTAGVSRRWRTVDQLSTTAPGLIRASSSPYSLRRPSASPSLPPPRSLRPMASTDGKSLDGDDPLEPPSLPVQSSMAMHSVGYSGMPMHMYPFPPGLLPSQPLRSKRRQVKNACTNCQKACKKCDDARPCLRCVKYGISEECVDSQRKERKKGIKRGPYKKRDGKGSSVEQPDVPAQQGVPVSNSVPPQPQPSGSPLMGPYMGPVGIPPGYYAPYPQPPGPKPGEAQAMYPYYVTAMPSHVQQQPPHAGQEPDHHGYPPQPPQFYQTFVAQYPPVYPQYMPIHSRSDGQVPHPGHHHQYTQYGAPMYHKQPSVGVSGEMGHNGGEGHDGVNDKSG